MLDGVLVNERVASGVPDRVWLEVFVEERLAVSVREAVHDCEDEGVPPVCVADGVPVCEEEVVLVCVDEGVPVGVEVGSTYAKERVTVRSTSLPPYTPKSA